MTEDEATNRLQYLEGIVRDLATKIAKETAGKIDAIRAYRAATGATLKDSKDFVESMSAVAKHTMEDSRIQRVEDRIGFLERRVNDLEGAA